MSAKSTHSGQDGDFKYVKIHVKSDQGIKHLTRQEAEELSGKDPNYQARDLFEAIERGEYPSWTVSVQVIEPKDAENYEWNIFDITRTVPYKDYPLRPIGKITLNENVSSPLSYPSGLNTNPTCRYQPKNFFEDIEQAAFSPSTMVPGIAPSADPSTYIPPSLLPSPKPN